MTTNNLLRKMNQWCEGCRDFIARCCWIKEDMKIKKYINKMAISIATAVWAAILFNTSFGLSYITGDSMKPALEDGSIIIMDRRAFPKRGDIVICHVEKIGSIVAKRVVGLEGDKIMCANGIMHINGKRIEETYLNIEDIVTKDFEEITVPDGSCFLLGDNREHSFDSRCFGFPKQEDIVGIVIKKIC